MKKLKKPKLPAIDAADVLIFAGVFIAAAGIWQIYRPASFIFVGLCSMVAGILSVRQVE